MWSIFSPPLIFRSIFLAHLRIWYEALASRPDLALHFYRTSVCLRRNY